MSNKIFSISFLSSKSICLSLKKSIAEKLILKRSLHNGYAKIMSKTFLIYDNARFSLYFSYRGRMYPWLEILLESGKSQLKRPIRVAQDMKLKLDSRKGCKFLLFCFLASIWKDIKLLSNHAFPLPAQFNLVILKLFHSIK